MGGEEEIVSILDSPTVEMACLHPTDSLEMMSVSWPVSMNPTDFFLFFIWSFFHLLSFLLLLSFSLLLSLSVDASEK